MKIRELLADESKWCQGHLALDETGNLCNPLDKHACRWCLVGAFIKCYVLPSDSVSVLGAWRRFQEIWGGISSPTNPLVTVSRQSLERFNDSHTFAEVRAYLEGVDL